MKKTAISALIFLLIACLAGMGCYAQAYEYFPDEEGCYTVTFEGETANEYIIFLVKGIYDETNYVEAFNNASDDDILYYEQLTSDSDGTVTFGPFVPKAYFDSTVIIGGTSLVQPHLAGYVRAAGISNIAGVEIEGVEDEYTVGGYGSEDVVIEVDAVLLDDFGYPAITDEKATISVSTNVEGITVDVLEGTVTVDKCAKECEFAITASYGDYSAEKTVKILRNESVANSIEVYDDEGGTTPLTKFTVELVEGFVGVGFYLTSVTLDQYGDAFEDVRTVYVDGVEHEADDRFSFTAAGDYSIKFVSNSNSDVFTIVQVSVILIPAYTGDAFTLYELIKESEQELELIGVTKFVSTDGKDVYPEYTWTTQTKLDAFKDVLENSAKKALSLYNSGEAEYETLANEVTKLTSALSTYRKSFKTGLRVDIESISIQQQNVRMPVTSATVQLNTVITPAVNTDSVVWTSSDPETVYVDANGLLTAKDNGTVIITATTSTGISAATTVTAYRKINNISLAESTYELTYGGEPVVIGITVLPANHAEILTWTSSRPDIVTVDSDGKITAQCKAGTAKIIVTGEHGKKAECSVKVTLPKWDTVAAPSASIAQGKVFKGTAVELTCSTPDASIYYTLDGSDPTVQSRPYVAPIVLSSDVTIKAIAVADKMFDSSIATYEYKVVTPEINIESAVVSKGYDAKIDISIDNNPGIKELTLSLKLPEGIELVAVEAGSALSSLSFQSGEDGGFCTLTWTGSTADSSSGVIATVTLHAPEDARLGEKVLEVFYTAENQAGETVGLDVSNAVIKILDVIIGDVNSDGTVDISDLVLLAQYEAEWPSAAEVINLAAADTKADGEINMSDVVILAQYVADWGVTLG